MHRVPHSNYTIAISSHPAVINVMHRVLLIDEVMVQILTNLGHSSRAEVAAMARVCRAFNELASDVIWKEIPSILPLIMCMPIDLVKKTYMKGGILRVVSYICEHPLIKSVSITLFDVYSRLRGILCPKTGKNLIIMQPESEPSDESIPLLTVFDWKKPSQLHSDLIIDLI